MFVDFIHVILLHLSQFIHQNVSSVERMASYGHVLRFADVQVTVVGLYLNDVLVKSVDLLSVDSLHLHQFKGQCRRDSPCSLFDYFCSLLYQGLSRMFRDLLRVAYVCAVSLPSIYCATLAGLIHCVCFMRPDLLVHIIALHILRSVNLQHNLLSFILHSFICYMEHMMSFVSQPLGRVCCLHHVQNPCHEFACPCSLLWVSVICIFILLIHLVFSYFCSALCYSRSFPVLNETSILHGPVHHSIDRTKEVPHILLPYGGGSQHEFAFEDIEPYVVQGYTGCPNDAFRFVVHGKHISPNNYNSESFVHTRVPLCNIISRLSIKAILNIAQVHEIRIPSRVPKAVTVTYFDAHHCATCNDAITIFSVVKSKLVHDRNRKQEPKGPKENACTQPEMTRGTGNSVQQDDTLPFQTQRVNRTTEVEQKPYRSEHISSSLRLQPVHSSCTASHSSTSTMPTFPPLQPDNKLMCDIAHNFCFDSSPDKLEEAGCAICGQLTPFSNLTRLKLVKQCLHILQVQGVTRIERKHSSKLIQEYKGPVLDYRCNSICGDCQKCLRNR